MVWWDSWGENKCMSLFLGVVSKCLALDIYLTCPYKLLCSSESVEVTLSRIGEAWACSMLARSCVITNSALSQSISPAENCGVKLGLGDVQATFRSLRSDLIIRITSCLQNNLVCVKVPGQYNRRMKVQLYGCWSQPERCCCDLVLLFTVFSFPLRFHFYSCLCSAPLKDGYQVHPMVMY